MNSNLIIIGYCHLEDGFLYASNALKKLNINIFFFPYFSYIIDNIEDRDNILLEYLILNKINICLWWNNSIKYENYIKIINNSVNIKHYLFNWDPHLYNKDNSIWNERTSQKELCYPLMDHVFTCFEAEINYFKNLNISYAPPGFDIDISLYTFYPKYECDVSIVCTNLYDDLNEFPNESTNITRYNIVNKLYENRHIIKFHIYGPEKFKDMYPDCYKGFIKYNECNRVFSNSKINLSIHPLVKDLNGEMSNAEYFSERVPQILGSKGLLVTNSLLTDKLIKNDDYIYINDDTWFDTILNIIKYSKKYDYVRMNGYEKALKYYTWNNWAEIIYAELRINYI